MFYDRFEELRREKEISVAQIAKSCGFDRTNTYKWRDNKSTPQADLLNRIADFFGVSVDYLLEKTTKKEPITTNSSDKLDSNLLEVLNQLSPELLEKVYIYAQGLLAASETKPKRPKIVPLENKNIMRMAGRDGRYVVKHFSDEELKTEEEQIDSLPDAPADL